MLQSALNIIFHKDQGGFNLKKAIVITLGVIIGVTGVLAICAHLADAARLALYVPEDDDDEDIY